MNDLKNLVITDVIDVMTIFSKKGRFLTMNDRSSFGLSFCISGQITYEQNGEKYVSDKSSAIILPKGQSYELHGDEDGYFPLINFEALLPFTDKILKIPLSNPDKILHKFEKLKRIKLFSNSKAEIMSAFYEIISDISDSDANDSIILPAISYIEKNFYDPNLENTVLAQACNISEVYLRKQFLKKFNQTPKQYIIDMRLQMAKQLLSEGALKSCAVSEKCGFKSPYHFCRLFKQKEGVTPLQYSKMHRYSAI